MIPTLEVVLGSSRYYACEVCGMIYADSDTARSCESWCSAHGSCNMEITKRAIGKIRRAGLRLR